jgi:hypothetical protein
VADWRTNEAVNHASLAIQLPSLPFTISFTHVPSTVNVYSTLSGTLRLV